VKGTIFFKLTGSGNDFICVDGRTTPVEMWSPEQIRVICARRTGVGADGFVVLEPGSTKDAVRFHYFNSNGGRADMCGNASLCATQMAARLRLAPSEGMVLETDSGNFRSRCLPGPGARAELLLSNVEEISQAKIDLVTGEEGAYLVKVGVPHLILPVRDLRAPEADPEVRGRELRSHPGLGDGGANVTFVGRLSEGWGMRTYERGVESETLACGTGAVAAAAVLAHAGMASFPWSVQTASGCTLEVSGEPSTNPPGILEPRLVGEGRLVFRGVIP
jgi:diaminopimelate epimerase